MKFDKFVTLIKEAISDDLESRHIEFADYNLEAKYKDFNQKYFGNNLPNIPVVWARLKGVGGVTRAMTLGGGYVLKPDSLYIQISNILNRSELSLDAVLIHEMIHVYFISIGDFKEGHGYKFIAMAKNITSKAGFNIPLKDEIEEFGVSDMSKVKAVNVILAKNNTGTYAFAIIGTGVSENILKIFLEIYMFKRYSFTEVKVYNIKSDIWNILSSTYPIQRISDKKISEGLQKVKMYGLSNITLKTKSVQDIVGDLEKNGKLIFHLNKQ